MKEQCRTASINTAAEIETCVDVVGRIWHKSECQVSSTLDGRVAVSWTSA